MKKIQKKHIHSIVEDDESVTIKFGKNMDEEKESDSKIVDEPPMETESEKKQEEIQSKDKSHKELIFQIAKGKCVKT